MQAWHHFYPAQPALRIREQLRAGLGALIGIGLCTLLVSLAAMLHSTPALHLVAPLGATAVLVFGVPNSPLAQPWSAVVGNVTSALVALAVVSLVPGPWSAGMAVGAAIVAMTVLRALHPPGGAVALLIALDPAPVLEAGPLFALMPVGVTTAILVVAGIAYNRATGRVYPFRQPKPADADDQPPRLGLTNVQLEELLTRFNQSTNLGVADLARLLAAAEAEAAAHRFDGTSCADVMTTGLITVRPDTPLPQIATLFSTHAIKSLPVVTDDMALQGIVLQGDLLESLAQDESAPVWRKRSASRTASDVMRAAERSVPHDLPVGALLNRLAAQGSEVIPVTREGRLVGILTRSDILELLLRGAEERAGP